MTIEYKSVHPQAALAENKPSIAIAMRPPSEYCHQHYVAAQLYLSVTFDHAVHGVLEVRSLVDGIIADHGKAMVHTANGKTTVWRVE